ncbi:hypothetical protein BCR43DRAFT_488769 [Syncephalastrum racemosum]|uniref:Uncharacterized protein n=1 Tax=Syncephalastrum racemosum TaxID=13706 RepID=A0A1X2HJE0_SYNRA|nr:hypothetical protein BCR43DRAFT_488769 [Syncephalastrum racemosum]
MEKSLSDYDQNLEELEKQREQLELVMQKMGTEWEQSGAGIGWMGVLDSVAAATTDITTSDSSSSITSPLDTLEPPKEERWHRGRRESQYQQNTYPYMGNASRSTGTATTTATDPMTMMSPSGPSPDYLRKLLNVKPDFVMQTLQTTPPPSSKSSSFGETASSSSSSSSSAMLMATPVTVSLCTASPPATPEERPSSASQHTTTHHSNTAVPITTTSSIAIAPPARSPINTTTAFSELVVSPLGGETKTKNSPLSSTSFASKLTTKPIAPSAARSPLPASSTTSATLPTTAADAAC